MSEKKQRLRFTYEDDLVLLKEFINNNPISNVGGWEDIKQNIFTITQKLFAIRTLKQHLMLLLDIYSKKVKVDDLRSGIEVPLNEKDNLLQEVCSMCKESNYTLRQPRKKSGSKEQQIMLLGKNLRTQYAQDFYFIEDESDKENLNTTSSLNMSIEEHDYVMSNNDVASEVVIEAGSSIDIDNQQHLEPETPLVEQSKEKSNRTESKVLVPLRKRKTREPVRKNALSFLANKHEKNLDLENRKLNLEERKLQLEERKLALQEKQFELERTERLEKLDLEKKRIEIELSEKQITQHLLQSQQILIDRVLKEAR